MADAASDEFAARAISELAAQAAVELQAGASAEIDKSTIEQGEAQAKEIISKGGDQEMFSGMEDMRKLSLSLGLPVPFTLFAALIDRTTAPANKKKKWKKAVRGAMPASDDGCLEVDFLDKAGAKRKARCLLAPCGPDHDLSSEIDQITNLAASAGAGKALLEHLSMLVHLGRAAYGQVATLMIPLLEKVADALPEEAGLFDVWDLRVDGSNTTLYCPNVEDRRVGIRILLDG